jgi:hypothetical protein
MGATGDRKTHSADASPMPSDRERLIEAKGKKANG